LLAVPVALAIAVARRRGATPGSIVPFALLPLPIFSSFVRAQVFSQVLFVCLLALLVSESRRPSRRVFLALPLLVAWANLHGAAVEGAALVSLLGVTEAHARRGGLRAAVLVAAPWGCLLATPYGMSSLAYYSATLWNPALRRTQPEWMAPTHSALAALIVFPLLAATIALVAGRRRALTAFELGALALTGAGALAATRSLVWFAYTSLALLPPLVEGRKRASRARSGRLTAAFTLAATLAGATGIVTAAASPSSRFEHSWPPPAAAVVRAAAEEDRGLRVFASPEFADWLLYEIPALRGRIAYDGRWELLSERQTLGIWRFLRHARPTPGWASGYGLVVLDPGRERELVARYEARDRFRVLYRTSRIIVLEQAVRR
jgi:hypothetical protein